MLSTVWRCNVALRLDEAWYGVAWHGMKLVVGSLIRPALSNDRADRAQKSQPASDGAKPVPVDGPDEEVAAICATFGSHEQAWYGPIVGQK